MYAYIYSAAEKLLKYREIFRGTVERDCEVPKFN